MQVSLVSLPRLLRKNAEQLGLFGSSQAVGLTPKAQRRKKLQQKWGQQMSLFGEGGTGLKPRASEPSKLVPRQGQSSTAAPAAVKGRRARRGGEFVAGKRYAGGQWIPKAAFEAQAKGQQYTPQSATKQPQQKLQVIEEDSGEAIAPTPKETPQSLKPRETSASPETVAPVDLDQDIGSIPEQDLDAQIEAATAERDRLMAEQGMAPIGGDSTQVEPAAADGVEPIAGTDVEYAAVSGAKQRKKVNQAALDLLAQGKTEYSPEEMITLAQYSGKGGLGKDTGSINEYYTRADVAAHVVSQLRAAGFVGGTLLEPACGTGVFLHGVKDDSAVLPIGVDISKDSSAIAAALNPHADVSHARFERFLLDNPDTQLDGITGNIPFGPCQMSGDDNDMAASAAFRDKYKTAEALFLTEGMKRLKPGGVMSVVVPHGVTTGSQHQKLRAELCKHGRVIGVQRLPGDAFEHTGTATVTDVLVMQKHPDSIADAIARGDKDTLLAVTDSSFIGGSYFEDNPDHVLGSVEETTNQWGGKAFKVNGSTEAALTRGKAQTLSPSVTYEGLEGVTATPEDGVPIGSTKSINGRQYRFEGDPPRWHRVDEEPTEPVSLAAEDYGHDTLEAVHEAIRDVGKRMAIAPEHLTNHLNLVKADGLLSGPDLAGLKAAHTAMNSGKAGEQGKIIYAMVLAHHLRALQDGGADGADIRQGLGMLMAYKEQYGSAAGDRTLTRLALDYPALLSLQGAFRDDGSISDYWANPSALKNQEERTAGSAGAAAGEAYRAYGANPVELSQVREFFPSDLPDDEFKAKVLADPTIGYSNGQFMPIQHLIKGDGFELMDDLQAQRDESAPGSAEQRKLQEQVDLVRSKMQLRTFEDLPVNIWNVGSWIPVQAFNEFCSTMGIQLQVEATGDGKFEPTRFAEDKKNKLNQGLLAVLNGQKIRANTTAEKGYLMKDALKDFQADFKDWLAATPYRDEIEDTYNRAFNARLDTEYSGDPLDIQGFDQSGGKRLHDYQCSTVRQMADQGRGIISLGVGLGKTATAIALAMHLKQQGRVKKNGFVVPKSVLANWVKELKFWAPDASVMVLGMSQQYWKDGSEAYEVPGYQMAMVGDKPQTFKDGSPKLRLVGDLKGMVLLTTGKGKAETYATDEQGNYLLFDEEDSDKPLKQREYTAISPEDLRANSVPLYGGGENLPVKDEQGNFVLFADGDRDRQNPIPFTGAALKKDGILSMVSDDAATKERKMQQTAQNAFDVVLMSEPVFQRINLTPEKYQEYVGDTVKRHINPEGGFAKNLSVRAAKRMSNEGPTEGDVRENEAGNLEEFRDGRWHRVSADDEKRGYAKLKQQEQKMGELVGRQGRKTSNIYWENLGIDNLIADEAHHYKNLFAPHRAESDIAYLSTAQSNRSLDFYFKAKHTLETNNSQNCYLLTATPTSNNPLEIYNMLVHIAPDELDSRGIHNIDQFLEHFGKVESVSTLNLKLENVEKTGLIGFQALRDLRKLTKQYVRIESAKSLQEKGNTTFRQPKKNQQVHTVQLTPQQQAIYADVQDRLEELQKKRQAGKPHEEGDDHAFSCISDMDKAALDIQHYANTRSDHGLEVDLSGPDAARSPKIEKTVEQVMASRQASQGKQIIFCDAVSMHDSLKASLVAAGYPEDEIVVVNAKEMPTATDRLRISQAYNSGKISLVIGNTATMGEGMNFQVGTTDIHHLNLPWTPKDIEQRDGRGVRQGNALDSVNVHYYLAEGSLDEYRQDNLARKEGAFDELWNGEADSASNLEAEMDQDTERLIQALSTKDPAEARRRIEQQKAEAEAKRKAEGAKAAFRQFESLQNKMKLYQGLTDEERLGEKGRGMLADINRSKARLQANEFFEHKLP
jgi:hypothetical protein